MRPSGDAGLAEAVDDQAEKIAAAKQRLHAACRNDIEVLRDAVRNYYPPMPRAQGVEFAWSSDEVTLGLCPARDRDEDELPVGFLAVDPVSRHRAVPDGLMNRVAISPGPSWALRPFGLYARIAGAFEALDVAHRVLGEAL